MNAMASVLGCNVQIGLWQEENTLMREVRTVKISKGNSDNSFRMYYTRMLGSAKILKQLEKEDYSCSKVSATMTTNLFKQSTSYKERVAEFVTHVFLWSKV